ncbi:hypothetical protein [Embleya sp. NPDC001921]
MSQEGKDGFHNDVLRWHRFPHFIGDGLTRLCLGDDPVPDELRALLGDLRTEQHDDLFRQVPWLRSVDPHHGPLGRIHDTLTPNFLWTTWTSRSGESRWV